MKFPTLPLYDEKPAPPAERVWVSEIREWFRPKPGEPVAVDWREGLTIAGALELAGVAGERLGFWINGDEVSDDLDHELAAGAQLVAIHVPAGPGFQLIPFLTKLFVVTAFSYLATKVLGPPSPARQRNDESSQVHGWSPQATDWQALGTPYPVLYGEHPYAGKVIGAYMDVEDGADPASYLNVLILMGLGPFEEIAGHTTDQDDLEGNRVPAGILINGNPATSYTDVRFSIRMGTYSQEPIREFDRIPTNYAVDLPLDNEEAPAAPVTDWTNAVSVKMTVVGESGRAFFECPQGLFKTGAGGLISELVQLQIRYREIDSGGNAIGGWVIHRPKGSIDGVLDIVEAHQSRLLIQVDFPRFWKWDTYQTPQAGVGLALPLSPITYAKTAAAPANVIAWTPGSILSEFTAVWTGYFNNILANQWIPLWSYSSATGLVSPTALPGTPVVSGIMAELYWPGGSGFAIRVLIGDGTAAGTKVLERYSAGTILANTNYRITATFLRNYDEGGALPHRLELYLGTQTGAFPNPPALFQSLDTDIDVVLPNEPIFLGSHGTGWTGDGTHNGQSNVSELQVWRRYFTGEEVTDAHNGGEWHELTIEERADSRLVGYWTMDPPEAGDAFHSFNDFSIDQGPNTNDLQWPAGAPVAIGGAVTTAEVGTASGRARFEIQAQRYNAVFESTEIRDLIRFHSFVSFLASEIAYRGLGLLFCRMRATDQLNTNRPTFLIPNKGRNDLFVWDRLDAKNPTGSKRYSAVPAHQAGHMILDRAGAGALHTKESVDWQAMADWEDYTSALVYDQRGKFKATRAQYWTPGAEFPDGALTLTFDEFTISHFLIGKQVRVSGLQATDADYFDGDLEIIQAETGPDGTWRVWFHWPDTRPAPTVTDISDPDVADVQGIEPRYESHFPMVDAGVPWWDALTRLARVGQAQPVKVADLISFAIQNERSPSVAFTQANIIFDTFRLAVTRRGDQFNRASAEFQNADHGYERDVTTRTHANLQDGTSTRELIHRTFDMPGCVRESQAQRALDYLLEFSQADLVFVEFATMSGAATFLDIGTVGVISYPLPSWSFGGRIQDDTADGVVDEVSIDGEVVLELGETYYVAVENVRAGIVGFAQLAAGQDGKTWYSGQVLQTATDLPFTPQAGDLWAIGTSEFGSKTFQLVSHELDPRTLDIRLGWVIYDESVFKTPASFEQLEAHAINGTDARDLKDTIERDRMPSTKTIVAATDVSSRDPDDGSLRKAIAVSWEPEPKRLGEIAETILWVQDTTAGGRPRRVARAGRALRDFVIDARAMDLVAGTTYRVYVQHAGAGGLASPVERCPSALVTVDAYYPPPPAPASASVYASGDAVVYEVALQPGWENTVVEVVRGQTFVNQIVGRIPIGGTTLRTDTDWAALTKVPPLFFRSVLPNGLRGELLRVDAANIVPQGYREALAEVAYEDGPWETEPGGAVTTAVLTELEEEAATGYLVFDPLSSELVGSYAGWEIDLGSAQRVHVAAAVHGVQRHPTTLEELGIDLDSARAAHWTPQGPLSPRDPEYGALGIELEWAHSATAADPGTTWEPFACGLAYFRSARFRVVVTRPTADWDVELWSLTAGVRALTASGDSQGSTLPATAHDGQRHLWTGAGAREWFFYHASSGFWLSERSIELVFGATAALSLDAYADLPSGVTTSSTFGRVLPADVLVTEAELVRTGSTGKVGAVLAIDGTVDAGSVIAADAVASATSTSLAVEIDAGEVIACKAEDGGGFSAWDSGGTHVQYTARRRLS